VCQERQRRVGTHPEHTLTDDIRGDGDPDVRATVRVCVGADHRNAIEAGDPVGGRGDLTDEVDPGVACHLVVAAAVGVHQAVLVRVGSSLGQAVRVDENQEQPGAFARVGDHAVPDGASRQVHGCDGRTPTQQGAQRADLCASTEHRDRPPLEAQPVGVGKHQIDVLDNGVFDDAVLDPGGQLPAAMDRATSASCMPASVRRRRWRR